MNRRTQQNLPHAIGDPQDHGQPDKGRMSHAAVKAAKFPRFVAHRGSQIVNVVVNLFQPNQLRKVHQQTAPVDHNPGNDVRGNIGPPEGRTGFDIYEPQIGLR